MRWYKFSRITAQLWMFCVLVFVIIIARASNMFSQDPDLSPGFEDHYLLLPMLASLFLGLGFYAIHFLTGLVSLVKKFPKESVPFTIPIKYNYFVVTLLVIFFFVGILLFIPPSSKEATQSYSGQELLEGINKNRTSKSLTSFDLDRYLCDNLVERYLAVKNPNNGHKGFEAWAIQNQVKEYGNFNELAELYVIAPTVQEAITFWEGSPGHRLTLENPNYTHACTYANDGIGVVVLGEKNK